jgi:hypothetical protein
MLLIFKIEKIMYLSCYTVVGALMFVSVCTDDLKIRCCILRDA